MITDYLLSLFIGLVNFFVGILPTWSLPSALTSSINNLITTAYSYDYIFPVTTVITIVVAAFGLLAIIILWQAIKWIIGLIRGN